MAQRIEIDYNGAKCHYNHFNELHCEDGPAIIHPDGDKVWMINGKEHREDGPAVEYAIGDKEWYINGKRHRIDGPAYEGAYGIKKWYFNNNLHRLDGPAIEWEDGQKEYWISGTQLSEEEFNTYVKSLIGKTFIIDGVEYSLNLKVCPQIIFEDGIKYYYNGQGQYHREDGPAIDGDAGRAWYINGKLHREDGPAVEWYDGRKYWWINGEYLSEEEFNNRINNLVGANSQQK